MPIRSLFLAIFLSVAATAVPLWSLNASQADRIRQLESRVASLEAEKAIHEHQLEGFKFALETSQRWGQNMQANWLNEAWKAWDAERRIDEMCYWLEQKKD